YKGEDLDGELISELTDELIDDKDSRDGISESLFPLRSADLPMYRFTLKGRTNYNGRPAYQIAFDPVKRDFCLDADDKSDCPHQPWKGTAWIDVEELQPMRIDTDLAAKIPWGVRAFLGTNARQVGFSITYVRVAEGLWFPATYGTEFRLDVLWFYKRTITMALESSRFEKTEASSKIEYDLAKEIPH